MGVPTSEVGYTSAMPRREDHKVHKDMWGHWVGGISFKTRHVCKSGLIDSEMVQTNKNKGNMKDYYASPENIS